MKKHPRGARVWPSAPWLAYLWALAVVGPWWSPVFADDTLKVTTETYISNVTTPSVDVELTSDETFLSVLDMEFSYDTDNLAMPDVSTEQGFFEYFDVSADYLFVDVDTGSGVIDVDIDFSNSDGITIPPAGGMRLFRILFELTSAASSNELFPVTINDGTFFEDDSGNTVTPDYVDGGIVLFSNFSTPSYKDLSAFFLLDESALVWIHGGAAGDDPTVEATIDLSTDSSPSAMAIAANGVLWLTFPAEGEVRLYDVESELDAVDVGSGPLAVAPSPDGGMWVFHDDGTLWKLTSAGVVLFGEGGLLGGDIELADGAESAAMSGDRAGTAWVGIPSGGLFRVGPTGEVLVALELDGEISDLAIDPSGVVWIALDSEVQRRSSDGRLLESFSIASGTPLDLAVISPELAGVTVGGGTENGLHLLVPGEDVAIIMDIDEPSGLSVTGASQFLVSDLETSSVYSVDPMGDGTTDPGVLELDSGPSESGDASPFTKALLLFPSFDFDGDILPNADELRSLSNPFDEDDSPEVPPVLSLRCTLIGPGKVELTWVNLVEYDEFTIGVKPPGGEWKEIASGLDGEETSYLEEDVTPGPYFFRVISTIDGVDGPSAVCRATVGAGGALSSPISLEDPRLVAVDVAATGLDATTDNAAGGGGSLQTAVFVAFSDGSIHAYDSNGFEIFAIASPYPVVSGIAYVPFGNRGNGSLLVSRGEPFLPCEIAELSLTGGVLRISADDTAEEVSDIDPPPIQALSFTGTTSDDGVLAATPGLTCEVWSFRYSDFSRIDELTFEHPEADPATGYPGYSGCEVIPGPSTTGVLGDIPSSLDIALIVDGSDLGLLAQRFLVEDGALAEKIGDPIPLFTSLEESKAFSGIGRIPKESLEGAEVDSLLLVQDAGRVISSVRFSSGDVFLRGDADGSGGVSAIVDALYILRWMFLRGDDPPCEDAADVNDDGTLSAIVDALYLLRWAFLDGDPPPDPGPRICGTDDTEDDVGCAIPPDCSTD